MSPVSLRPRGAVPVFGESERRDAVAPWRRRRVIWGVGAARGVAGRGAAVLPSAEPMYSKKLDLHDTAARGSLRSLGTLGTLENHQALLG